MHASYLSIQGAAAGGLPGVRGQPGLQCEAKRKKKKKEEKPKHKLNLKDTSIPRKPRIPSARVPQCSWNHVIRTPKLTLRETGYPDQEAVKCVLDKLEKHTLAPAKEAQVGITGTC